MSQTIFKYLTWVGPDGYYNGNELLSMEQIISTISLINKKPNEVFVTIQDYDKEGNIIGSLVYFDIDSESLIDAYDTMTNLVMDIMSDFEIEPAIYFSGGKGFHVIAPLYIRHPRCHEIAKIIASDFCKDADPKVYRTRSMFRCYNSYHRKGKFKIAVNYDDKLETILSAASSVQTIMPSWIANWNVKDIDISDYVKRLPELSDSKPMEAGSGMFTPCIKKIWDKQFLDVGERHSTLYLMVRFFFSLGLQEDETERLFAHHPFWSTISKRDYVKVIRSVYSKGVVNMGCKHGQDSAMMQKHCELVCPFNEKFNVGFLK